MNRVEAQAFVDAIVLLRNHVTDEIAASCPAVYPVWRMDTVYSVGDRVTFNGNLYKCLTQHISQDNWTPVNAPSLWAKVLIPDETVIPEWEQPDSTNPYMQGDKVTHNGKTWVSNINNNVWEPGGYGWEEVI